MIEYDGEQHYRPVNFGNWDEEEMSRQFALRQKYDLIKTEYCISNNINLLRIPYWEKENIDEIVKNHLQRLNRGDFVETA